MEKRLYKETPQGELNLFIHFPADWDAGDRRPAIVFFFGGGWQGGSPEQFRPQAEYFAGRGLVTVRVEYRVKSRHDVLPDECVEDAKSAVRWVRSRAAELGVDPDRIVASGGSAGGHLAACTATTVGLDAEGEDASVSSRPNLLVLYNPVLDLRGRWGRGLPEETVRLISPNVNLTGDTPAAVLFYGVQDDFLTQARTFMQKSKGLGNPADLYTAEGVGHAFFNREPWLSQTTWLADRFLAQHGYLEGEPIVKLPDGIKMTREDKSPEQEVSNP